MKTRISARFVMALIPVLVAVACSNETTDETNDLGVTTDAFTDVVTLPDTATLPDTTATVEGPAPVACGQLSFDLRQGSGQAYISLSSDPQIVLSEPASYDFVMVKQSP